VLASVTARTWIMHEPKITVSALKNSKFLHPLTEHC
jgi:hypothetical protein